MKKIFSSSLFFICACASTDTVYAQSKIHGSVIDINGKPIHTANVLLLKSTDSSLVKGTVTNEAGNYYFNELAIGKYFITSTFTGLQQSYTSLFNITTNH